MDKQQVANNALKAMADEDDRRSAGHRASILAARSWHLVQIGSRALTMATRYIEHDLGYGVYSPQIRTMEVPPAREVSHAQRKHRHLMAREKLRALFPGYSFVHFSVTLDPWRSIFSTVGVYGIHCLEGQPRAMPDEFIAGLRAREVDGAVPRETLVEEIFAAPAFTAADVGTDARPKDGPFIGFTGPIEKVDEAGRISLLLTFLGSTRTVTFDADQLEKLPATHRATG
jgi:transcription antitermination factor NusG